VRGLLLLLLWAAPTFADEANTFTLRGNYWRDRNTRVLQPEASLTKELPTGTLIGATYLLDAITSASQAAGATRDTLFTELRNQFGFGIGQRIGRTLTSFAYSYSSESDYWAHTISASEAVDLWQKNTTLGLSMTWGINHAALRSGATSFIPVGGLQTWTTIFTWTQVLSQTLLGVAEYDLGILGFGDELGHVTGSPNGSTGFQANPYRMVNLGGSPTREVVPFQRIRQSVQASLHWMIPTRNRIVPYLVFRPSYRFYWDDWGVNAHTVELRSHVPVGPVELRLTGRYYNQGSASFASLVNGTPSYPSGMGKHCTACLSDASRGLFYTSDPKLYAGDTFFLDVRLAFSLRDLAKFRRLPLREWLSGGFIEINYGHYFDSKVAQQAYGDADVAGLQFTFPL
jgi:hypothetical protein